MLARSPEPAPPFTPGAYLKRRRSLAGIALAPVARELAALPLRGAPAAAELAILEQRLARAEADAEPLTLCAVELVANSFALDARVYEQLVDLHLAGPASGLPVPQLCRSCACSFFDPCHTTHGPCSWAEPDLCSACADHGPHRHTHRRRPFFTLVQTPATGIGAGGAWAGNGEAGANDTGPAGAA